MTAVLLGTLNNDFLATETPLPEASNDERDARADGSAYSTSGRESEDGVFDGHSFSLTQRRCEDACGVEMLLRDIWEFVVVVVGISQALRL